MAKKIKEKQNLKTTKIEDLKKDLSSLEEQARLIRFKREGSKSKNVKEYSSLKKQIARILTEMNLRNKK